ncbi:arylsulfatase B-like [Tropilaelaps mercedesae]|uniref:Arylsulfatase B-like n=1 Tax=Tropilaelaps mercedesae TaxID=418985 RepID=A0A1V9XS62_9ACAR|nr:arylsulfatase B-like [Tropilaelaps mercedesae]
MLVNKSDKPIMAKSYYRVVRLLMLAFAAQLGQGSDPVTDPLRGVLPVKKQSPRNPLRPHIILIVLDDLGWDDVSLHGSPQIDTPNIDRLAKEGVLLENYYTQPLCTPSRGALMTGMYPAHLGLQHDVIKGPEPWGLPTKFKIMPQYLNEAGYESHIVGKWHLGHSRSELLPTRRGFKTHFGCRLGRTDYFDHWSTGKNFAGLDLWSNESPEKGYYGIYGTDLFTNRAIGILEVKVYWP